ncbi:DNA-binding transcriptional regulator GalS [Escherichia coli O157:H43 str. T22]|nr:DNA-binding transcriptional regulator GalS [Escherichia coli O157:H43 str. T22]
MITIRDVARQAGVSVATVSRVLNNSTLVSADTREAVMKAVSELDYRPNANAQALATQVSDTIGVVVMDVSDAFFRRAGKSGGSGRPAASEIRANRQ